MGIRILFQGDSITDAGRNREDPHEMGNGYPKYAKARIAASYPQLELDFLNLGIGGNRTEHLVERLETDFIQLQPDIVSILVGINDTWHQYGNNIITTDRQFEDNYRTVLTALKERTHAKILMLEPFLLSVPDKDHFRENLDFRIDIVRRLAWEYADAYIPLDGLFAAACVHNPPTHWAADGVHPTPEGADFIAGHYLTAVAPLIDQLNK